MVEKTSSFKNQKKQSFLGPENPKDFRGAGKQGEKKVSPKKAKNVENLAGKIKESRTILVTGIKNLPSRQFQEIRKKLRGKADIKMARINIMTRAIELAGVGAKKLEPYVKENTVILFSKLDPFELSSILSENKTPASARAGDIVPEDVEVEAGPTDLIPGPIISELGSLGIKISVEDGKITIRENKIIARAGEKVNEGAASLMQKLGIKPLSIGFEPIAAYDNEQKMLYTDIKVDKEATLKELKESHARAFSLAVKIAYACKDTISMLLKKASLEFNKLNNLINAQIKPVEENKS